MRTTEILFDKRTHRYTVCGRIVPSVTQIITGVGLYALDFVSRQTLAVAAERGSLVHTYIEWYERGTLDESSVDPELAGYFRAYLAAKKAGALPASPSAVELRIYSDKYKYAGTLDQLYGDRWVHDHKTGAPDPVHGLQLSAYWLALHPDMTDKPERLTCGYYFPDGAYEVREYPYEPLAWLAVRTDYQWRAKNGVVRTIGGR